MFERLQPHVLTRCPDLLASYCDRPSALHRALVEKVDDARSKGQLRSRHEADKLVQRFVDDASKLPRDLTRDAAWSYEAIHGGEKVFRQERGTTLDLERDDGAWFHFTIAIRSQRSTRSIELLGYNFEIVFPHTPRRGPGFLRWDFNPSGHTNDQRSLRAHLHPGVDEEADFAQVPTPVMHPIELLSLFIERLRW